MFGIGKWREGNGNRMKSLVCFAKRNVNWEINHFLFPISNSPPMKEKRRELENQFPTSLSFPHTESWFTKKHASRPLCLARSSPAFLHRRFFTGDRRTSLSLSLPVLSVSLFLSLFVTVHNLAARVQRQRCELFRQASGMSVSLSLSLFMSQSFFVLLFLINKEHKRERKKGIR